MASGVRAAPPRPAPSPALRRGCLAYSPQPRDQQRRSPRDCQEHGPLCTPGRNEQVLLCLKGTREKKQNRTDLISKRMQRHWAQLLAPFLSCPPGTWATLGLQMEPSASRSLILPPSVSMD